MAKRSSKVAALLGRLLKIVMVVVALPLAVGLLEGIRGELELISASGATLRQWAEWGALTYVGMHVLLYRPAPLFRISHRLFSTLAVWLFGGHVTSVEESRSSKGKGSKEGKGEGKGQAAAEGSTLVAFSPYVIPLYTILTCAAGWGVKPWLDRVPLDAPLAFVIGLTMAFHWLMTADDLQQQRALWHMEAYLLAISLVFVLTLLIASATLPWAVPAFSFVHALADGCSRAQAIYSTIIQRLFL